MDNQKQIVPSWTESWARNLIIRFLNGFISSGRLILSEKDGTILTFEGETQKCSLNVSVKVHTPQFYWKVATEAELGFAEAYINGDISFVDANQGLLDLFEIYIFNRDLKPSVPSPVYRRWGTPLIMTAGLASAKYFFKNVWGHNTLKQARRSISQHYDLSNKFFSLFMDETMLYSAAIFKSEDEDSKVAQFRKISALTEKARISKEHHVLDLGCGWGTLAIEVVKRTGCKCTGITLSEQQLIYAEQKVKEAGLQDHIELLLCDYRQLSDTDKYDRIIACEILEHVGHEFYETFFSCCDSLLAENGILVLQFTAVVDQNYDETRRIHTMSFIRNYIFPGGCLPSLNRVTTAMTAASRFCVQHVENIGYHYYTTLRHWRRTFLKNKSEVLALGFEEEFFRIWEYYLDYCAAGFKTGYLQNYQVVFSRPGNAATFVNLQNGESSSPSAY